MVFSESQDRKESSCSKKACAPTPVSSEKPKSLQSPVSDKAGSSIVASQVVSSHSPDNSPSVKSTASSSSVEITKVVNGKDVLNETMSTQGSSSDTSEGDDVSGEEDDEYDPNDINVQDIEPEETDTGVNDKFVCVGCGNKGDDCHQYKYGSWLAQEAISFLHENEPDEFTESDVRHRMKYSYNQQLNFDCYKETFKYDSNC